MRTIEAFSTMKILAPTSAGLEPGLSVALVTSDNGKQEESISFFIDADQISQLCGHLDEAVEEIREIAGVLKLAYDGAYVLPPEADDVELVDDEDGDCLDCEACAKDCQS